MGTLVILLASVLVGQVEDLPDSPEEVERRIRVLAESLETVRFVAEEFSLDADGGPVEPPFQRFEYSGARGGRRRVRATSPYRGREVTTVWYYEDGEHRHDVEHLADDADRISSVRIRDQVDSDDRYSELMNGAMSLYMPRGRTLEGLLDDGGVIRSDRSGSEPAWVMEVPVGEHQLRIELDPEHDWLPRKVGIAGFHEDVCTRFDRVNGRWFPVEGRSWAQHGGETESRGFRVTSLSLNHAVDPADFAPRLGEGVLVTRVERGMIVGEYVGGSESRGAKEARIRSESRDVLPGSNAVAVRRDGTGLALGLAGLGLIVAGLAARRFRRLSRSRSTRK